MGLSARLLFAACVAAAAARLQANPIFNYTLGSGVTVGDSVYSGFVAAGNRWSAQFSDNVTINVKIDYQPLGPGILASTGNEIQPYAYSTVRTALIADAKTATDTVVLANLQPGPALIFAANHTFECGNCTTPYLDDNANNRNVNVTRAEAKAMGLLAPSDALDASITFNSGFSLDFDPSNGISAGQYDFAGIATHEIGYILGFESSVDDYDYCGASNSNCGGPISGSDENSSVLDLFRYSNPFGTGYIMDQSADARDKYFSIDGGQTLGPLFSSGVFLGDGYQASHWKNNSGGIMDPTAAAGQLLLITQNDITALDAIGWDAIATPEPFSAVLLLIGIACVWCARFRHWNS